jgi:hypothetical protein
MTLLDIERDICRRLDKNPTNLDPETKARLDTFINDRYRELMRLDGINLRDETRITIQSTPNHPRVVLPQVAGSIVTLRDINNGRVLTQRTLSWIRAQDPSEVATGTPAVYAILNEAGILAQPTNFLPGNTELVSSAADQSDIYLEFEESHGGFLETTVTLNGTTPVVVPSLVIQIFRMTRSEPAQAPNSAVTWRQIDPPLNLAHLPLSTLASGMHQWTLYLYPIPSGAFYYLLDAARPLAQLVHPTDEPALPLDFHTLLVWGGCAEECLKMDDNRREIYENKYQTDVRRLRAYLHHSRGERWIPGQSLWGRSDLPGNYPAG